MPELSRECDILGDKFCLATPIRFLSVILVWLSVIFRLLSFPMQPQKVICLFSFHDLME